MKKRVLSVLLSAALCAGLLPVTAFAAPEDYGVEVFGVPVTSANANNIPVAEEGRVSYDPDTGVVTLDNATIVADPGAAPVARATDVVGLSNGHLNLIGYSTYTLPVESNVGKVSVYGWESGGYNEECTISGTGTLKIKVEVPEAANQVMRSYGFCARTLTMEGGTLIVEVDDRAGSDYSYGFYIKETLNLKSGSITGIARGNAKKTYGVLIGESSDVDVTIGNRCALTGIAEGSAERVVGIYTSRGCNLTVKDGGSVTATATGNGASVGNGIRVEKNKFELKVQNGGRVTSTVTGGFTGEEYGIRAPEAANVLVENGSRLTVDVTGDGPSCTLAGLEGGGSMSPVRADGGSITFSTTRTAPSTEKNEALKCAHVYVRNGGSVTVTNTRDANDIPKEQAALECSDLSLENNGTVKGVYIGANPKNLDKQYGVNVSRELMVLGPGGGIIGLSQNGQAGVNIKKITSIDSDSWIYAVGGKYACVIGGGVELPEGYLPLGYELKDGKIYSNGELAKEVTIGQYQALDTQPEPYEQPVLRPAVPQYPVYTVNVNKTPGGQVLHKRFMDATREATLTAVPEKGYKLESIKVTDKNGEEVALTAQDGGKYTFTMPGCDVNVDAVFSGSPVPPWENPFTDVSESDWFYDAVEYVQENGLMNGTTASTFSPYSPTSRAMIATILWRQAGSPQVDYLMDFEDVASGQWYTEAVRWAASEGIVNGYGNGKFGPNDPITREQLAVMLYNYERKQGGNVNAAANLDSFTDVSSVSSYALNALHWAVSEGIITGTNDGRLNPGGRATRAETAAMLQRYLAQ